MIVVPGLESAALTISHARERSSPVEKKRVEHRSFTNDGCESRRPSVRARMFA